MVKIDGPIQLDPISPHVAERTFARSRRRENLKDTPYARDPDLAYDRTRNNLLEGPAIAKAVTEATLPGPMKAVCELGISLPGNDKASKKFTRGSLPILNLDESIGTLPPRHRPAAIAEFKHAQQQYVAGLKVIGTGSKTCSPNEAASPCVASSERLQTHALIQIIASIKEEIAQPRKSFCRQSQTAVPTDSTFQEATSRSMIVLQEEAWKMASLGLSRPDPWVLSTSSACLGRGLQFSKRSATGYWRRSGKAYLWLCDIGGRFIQFIFARFFFSKNARSTSETDIVCTKLAKDLGSKDDTIRAYVKDAFEKDEELGTRPLSYQF
ncbi:SubName: Full=Uncharacterized protein {ECO:0000313/EMBL:CCA73458.1} [Serendipita indica DSM 11827]|nr:SubName: Full=Uncharacterized protein {ECO:0000313/EMBL:CCA73458.1} [Serendipita indica DSM 11827]